MATLIEISCEVDAPLSSGSDWRVRECVRDLLLRIQADGLPLSRMCIKSTDLHVQAYIDDLKAGALTTGNSSPPRKTHLTLVPQAPAV